MVDGSLTIRTLAELADGPVEPLERFHRVDALAFGMVHDDRHVAAKRRIIDPERFVIVTDPVEELDVGAAGNFAFDLTLPGGTAVPVGGVGDVGVVTSHRRRRILSMMMSWLLDDSARRDEVASVLTASQATIYGRFGYGMAVPTRGVDIPVARAAIRDDAPVADGSLRLHDVTADRAALTPVLADLHRRCAANGTMSRSDDWWSVVLGDAETYVGGNVGQRVLLHLDPAGRPDAYALYRIDESWDDHGARSALQVREVVGTSPAAQLAVWAALFSHDLIETVRVSLPPHHLLDDVLVDIRALRARSLRDHIWLRPLDVVALLSARTYEVDGTLVLSVVDGSRPDVDGTYRLDVVDGRGECVRTSEAPMMTMGTGELGARLLGHGTFAALERAARVRGERGALLLADAMFAADPPPWTDTKF